MAITNVSIGNTYTTLFTSPTGTEQAVTTMFFCNTSNNNVTLDIFITPGGTSVGASSQIMKALPLPAGETFVFDAEKIILESTDYITAQASLGNSVVATISTVQTS